MRRALTLWLLLAAACDHKPATTTPQYDRACTSGGMCVPIFAGPLTSCAQTPQCPTAAIRTDEVGKYGGDVIAGVACGTSPAAQCPPAVLTCETGLCTFRLSSDVGSDAGTTLSISAAGYPKTCEGVADCVSVYEGPLGCCGPPCPNTAISANAESHYNDELARRAPFCYPTPPCPPIIGTMCPGRIDCQNGQCVLLGAQP